MTRKFIYNLLFLVCVIVFPLQIFAQPGCPSINAGVDQTVTCASNCANLTSTYLATGATSSYSVSSISYSPPYSYNAGTPLLVNVDDTWSGVLNIPFNFCFFGTAYTQLVAGSNGCITFNTGNASTYCAWSYSVSCPNSSIISGSTGPFILGPYHDIDPSVTGDMYYNTYGSYPCRTFVVSWNQIAMYSCNSLIATHMIVMYESTNVIEVYIQNKPTCTTWNSGNAVIGIQDAAGTTGYIPAGRNTGQWTTSNEAWRFTPNGTTNYAVSWWQGGTQIATGATTTVCPATTTTYTAQIVYTNCNSAQVTVTDQMVVNVNTSMPVSINPASTSICSGGNTTLTASGGSSYTWSTGGSGASISVSPSSTTTYTVTATLGSCTNTAQATVTVNSAPPADAGLPQTICTGNSATLTATGGGTYQWSTGAGTQSITVSPGSTTTYTVTVTASGCTASDNVTVTVNSSVIADAGLPQTICTGQSATLTATGGTSYQWNTGATTQSITVTPGLTTTYTVTASSGGCSGTDNVIVTVNSIPSADAGLPQSICTGQSATLTASGGGTYVWSTGAGTQSISVNPGSTTTYTVTVTSSGCTASDNVTVTVNSIPTADAGLPQTICPSVSATLTASGGGTYAWSTGAGTQSITVSPASTTTYTVTVTLNGCTASDNVTVTVNSAITADAGLPQTICTGQSATLTATGGTSYQWSTGATTQSISVNPGSTTTYTVTASSGGCSGTDNVVVTVNASPAADAGLPQAICVGSSATLTASGGGTYQWDTGPATQSITINPASTTTYTVTVTLSGCTASDNVTVTVNPLPTADAGLPQTICLGFSATLTASGGGTYAWNTGPTTQSITISPGSTTTYTVTVTLSGCTASDNVTVTVNSAITADAGFPQTICSGQSATLTATGGSAYQWSTGGVTQSITVSPISTTTYTVTASSGGCSGTDDVVVTVNTLPAADAGSPQAICAGSSATLTASGGGTYQWDTGPTTQSITVNPTSTTTYTVTVTLSGCTASDNTTVTVNPIPIADAGLPQTICPGYSATLTATGGSSYLWNTGLTTASIVVTPSSTTTYSVTVTALGCSATDDVTVTVSAGIIADAGLPQTICSGQSATFTASGGAAYQWSNGDFTQSITVSPIVTTTYTVTASSGGCSGTDNVTLTVNSTPAANAGTDQIICYGQNVNLTAFGGGTYQWSNFSTNQSTNVAPTVTTIYTVTVTSAAGCTASDEVQVTVNPLPNASAGPDQSICYGNSATLNASGGVQYAWSPTINLSNPLTANPIANPTTTTTYAVTVTDANGCSNTDDMTLGVFATLPVDAGPDQSICSGQSTPLSASGGVFYNWSPGIGLTSTTISNPDASPTSTTTYTVTVSDANGCTASDNVIITVYPVPTSNFTLTSPVCVGEVSDITYTGTAGTTAMYSWDFDGGTIISGAGQGPYQISWSNPSIYNISLTVSENGCTSSTTSISQIVGQVTASVTVTDSITCYGANDGTATVTASGASPYQYMWSNMQMGATAQGLSANTLYSVTVTDNNGCTATQSITLTQPPQLTMNFSSANVSCFGGSNGFASASVSGGTMPYQYGWLPVGTAGNVNAVNTLQAGTYTFMVYDAHGCTLDTTFTVSQPPLLTYTYITDSVNCNSGSDGSINITVTGGNPPYAYLWNPGVSTDSSASNLSAGTYNVTITDHNGCDTFAVITVDQPMPLVLTTSGNAAICNGQTTTISSYATGGTGSYTFNWDSLGTGNTFNVNPVTTTTYTVSVTDGNGCTAPSQSLTVTVSPPISVLLTSSPSSLCLGESTVLTATANGGNGNYTYTWGAGIGISTSSIIVTPSSTTTYPVTVTDNCNSPQGVDSVTITVYPLPQVQFISDTINGCEPLVVSFSDQSTPTIASWLWNFGDTQSGSNNNSTQQNPSHFYSTAGLYTVSLSVTTTDGCIGSVTYSNMIEVYPTPDAYFSYYPQTISIFDPNVNFIDLSTGASAWNWNFGDPATISNNTSDEQSPSHDFSNPGTYNITLIITSQYGCVDSTSTDIIVNPEFTFYAPSAFTPDGNGKNDFFFPKGEGFDLNNYELYIFDRWGEMIFKTNNYDEYWDGKAMGGNEVAQQDVYTWLVIVKDFAGDTHTFNGLVTLLRK